MAHHIELFDDNIAILPLETAGQSQGGIIIPETARKKSQRGRVIFAGPGRPRADMTPALPGIDLVRWPMPVKVGDIAIYRQYAGDEIETAAGTVTIMKASELLGRVTEVTEAIEAPQEEKNPTGFDRPPCPICGMETIAGESPTFICENCGAVSDHVGVPTIVMAQCRCCKRVDYVLVLDGESRVTGCLCGNPAYDVLSPEQSVPYLRVREAVESC